ncbi:MAG: N-6 DNA methylase [Phycisphaerae bacterium]|nr:N-6 DNA methylase [Planctomycetota bacterium]MBL7220878.1 N-6 DNA methylase [Phycisphaerae bacterium]
MTVAELLDKLGYADSDNYLSQDRGDFDRVVDYGHLFRKAARKPCHLQGVYSLKGPGAAIPIVYVCDVKSESDAKKAHRLVWNQDSVPFLIVNSPETVRLYPGFCRQGHRKAPPSIRTIEKKFASADLEMIAESLSASAVDSGKIWREWGQFVRPEHRVDWKLLDSLSKLDKWLQKDGLQRDVCHALIGKYVYLHYLRHRNILSDERLAEFKIRPEDVFGRDASTGGLKALSRELDDWLNGRIFPIDFSKGRAPDDKYVSRVAATFGGDQPFDDKHWQLHLEFEAYDFSYIPIEVLSTVYEQFLHSPGKEEKKSRGRDAGAYYTPIPVVNLMLSEIEEHRPLKRGMRVFDPACGSGAFLVQAFRRLIEREFPPSEGYASPIALRKLLEGHIYGLDTDADACNVTRLSLVLTLLDYVNPPDLLTGRPGRKPKLPDLCNNIFQGNFFDDDGDWQQIFARKKADWVLGNPPWKQLKKGNIREEDKPVLAWMKTEKKHRPVGNQQMARAFAWRVAEYVGDDGEVALFMPAMTLFEEAAKCFRSRFLQEMSVNTIVNFSNLRRVISAGRFIAPAAAFFYHPRSQQDDNLDEPESIRTYSPLVANQEATRPDVSGKHNESWSILLNASEIRDVPLSNVASGEGLPWKVAFWGSHYDAKLLRLLQRRFKTIGEMEKDGLFIISEGLQLRTGEVDEDVEPVELPSEPNTVNVKALKGMRNFFALPTQVMEPVPDEHTHIRKGRAKLPFSVCQPPHVLVSAARNFAVYSDQFFVVPSRQIGVSSPSGNGDILKALSLFLSSDFAFYFEFFASTQLGIERDRSTLRALRRIPTPLMELGANELEAWASLHDRLVEATLEAYRDNVLWKDDGIETVPHGPVLGDDLMRELNDLVYRSLELAPDEHALVEDLMHVRLDLADGKLGVRAVGPPKKKDLKAYGSALRKELDDYICGVLPGKHDVHIIYDAHSAMVCMVLADNATKGHVFIEKADSADAMNLEAFRQHIRQKRSQWVYFDRNLRIYDGSRTYILKPMQRFHWTRSQARLDAMDIISESMARRDEA